MLIPTPEDRACLQFALHVSLGYGPENDIYVLRDCRRVFVSGQIEDVDPSSCPLEALTFALTQAMKLHLGGIGFGKLRNDLLGSGVGEQFANRIHDHLADVLDTEWAALRGRIRWYRDDTTYTGAGETDTSGDT